MIKQEKCGRELLTVPLVYIRYFCKIIKLYFYLNTGIRNKLLETEDHICPSCDSIDVSPDGLIINQMLRRAVTNFKNESGYTKQAEIQAAKYAAAGASHHSTLQHLVSSV